MANNVNGRIRKMIILPSTFIGSPHNMLQNYQDAMAIVSKFSKQDLFITIPDNKRAGRTLVARREYHTVPTQCYHSALTT